MNPWQLWEMDEVLCEVPDVTPLLASWERKTHPAQLAMREYLCHLEQAFQPWLNSASPLALLMEIDVKESSRLSQHYDLENYVTPIVSKLNPHHFVLATARKYVGSPSDDHSTPQARIAIGTVRPRLSPLATWEPFSYAAGSGTQTKAWKQRIQDAIASGSRVPLAKGMAEVHLAWRCSPARNWVSLWKPTGDAMGPVLGEYRAFSPHDDRIVALNLHLNTDASIGHNVDIGMWWRHVEH